MKKKIIVLGVATDMALSLTACGSSGDKKTTATKPTKTTEGKKEEQKKGVDKINLDNSEGSLVYKKHEVAKDSEGKPAVRIYFKYTNKSDDTKSAQSTFYPQVFQNGKECDFTMGDFDTPNKAEENLSKELHKGTSETVAFIYKLQDKKHNVTLKVSDQSTDGLANDIYQEQLLALK